MRTLLLATLLATSLLQAAAQAYDLSLGRYIQTPMPEDWYSEGFTRGHLNISRLMQDGFTRLQAVEIQNHMKTCWKPSLITWRWNGRIWLMS